MTEVASIIEGKCPLLISIPHDGRQLAPGMLEQMTDVALALPDTDWHVRKLYQFAENMGASVIAANFSRYVVDLNRAADDKALYDGQVSTGLCPARTFSGDSIYRTEGGVSHDQQTIRIRDYWQPYHQQLASMLADIRRQYGYALLWDAHSISSEVPLLFDGVLPDLNLGTNDGKSCHDGIACDVMQAVESSPYSAVLNARFRGGFITRNYGASDSGIHAMQLELSQRNYMNEDNLDYDADSADALGETVKLLLNTFLGAAEKMHAGQA